MRCPPDIRHLPLDQYPTDDDRQATLRTIAAMNALGLDEATLARAWGYPLELVEEVLAGRAHVVIDEPTQEASDFNRTDALAALGVDADMQGYI